ncbi:MAG TPA: hypothetical protein VG055_31350 [Planctomycetaceae bacterium]|nr:hypothetical protein [Planctomycetaceae bacterium]
MNRRYVTCLVVTSLFLIVCLASPSTRLLTAEDPPSAAQDPASSAPDAATPTPTASNPEVPAPDAAADDPAASDPNLQVMTKGAVHEAFAQPVLFNPAPSPAILNKPPDPVQEMPAAQKPQGANVQWLPGHWSWDTDLKKFVWTSGIWRSIPPGLSWVPGYWTHGESGYQWVSGFWRRRGTGGAATLARAKAWSGPGSDPSAAGAVNSGDTPVANAGQDPGVVPVVDPGTPPAHDPVAGVSGADPATTTATDPATNPSTDPGTNSVPDPGSVPGTDPGTTTVPDPGTTSTPDPGTTSAPDTGTDPTPSGVDPNANPDPNTNPGVVPGGTDSGTQKGAGSDDPSGVTYCPKPPDSLESGPVGDPPSNDCVWIPGTWIYRGGRFLWLAGQWGRLYPGWSWVPAHFCWAPAGYVFVDGFWDYDLSHRGTCFAPCAFNTIPAAGFVYSPTVVLNCETFTEYLFCQPQCGCYCFGDYYGPSQLRDGCYPWFAFHMSHFGYDPLYACCSWQHRHDVGWHQKLIADYRQRRDHMEFRPPHTYSTLLARAKQSGANKTPALAMSLSKWAARPGAARFEKLSQANRDKFRKSAQSLGQMATRRLEVEKKSLIRQPVSLVTNKPVNPQRPGPKINHPVVQPGKLVQGGSGSAPRPGEKKTTSVVQPGKLVQGGVSTPHFVQKTTHPVVQPGKTIQPTPVNHPMPKPQPIVVNPHPANGLQRPSRPQFHTNPAPPVVQRRPVVMNGNAAPPQPAVRQHPADRLVDTRYVPHPATQGRPQQHSNGRRG